MIFAGLNCRCGQERHYQGVSYYVTVRRETRAGWEHSKLVGPFPEHDQALALVNKTRRVAEEIDPRAVWYAFGTAAAWNTTEPGRINDAVFQCCPDCLRVSGERISLTGPAAWGHWAHCPQAAPSRRRANRKRPAAVKAA